MFIYLVRLILLGDIMEIAMTKISSKGQVVIPQEMRIDLKEGDKLIIMREGDHIILKKATVLNKQFKEDFEFAKKTEEAYQRILNTHGTTMEFGQFIEEMKKW